MALRDKTKSHSTLAGIKLLDESGMTPWGGLTFEVPGPRAGDIEGRTILAEAADQNLTIRSDCGGKGLCGKCQVLAEPSEHLSPLGETESRLLSPEEITRGYRLACQARVLGPVSITVALNGSGAFEVDGKTGIHGSYPVDPSVKQIVWSAAMAGDTSKSRARDAIGQAEASIEELTGRQVVFRDLYPVRELSQFSQGNVPLTLTWHEKKGITAVVPGMRSRSLGVAVDIGTTTVAAYLCDLATGAVLASAAAANPQQRFGEDVLSRIAFAKEAIEGTRTMQKLIAAEINALIVRCLDEVGAIREDVDEMVVVGNTTMQHLFAGINPRSLGGAPYLPVTCAPVDLRAADLGVDLSPATNVHVFPVISGFVGGDTLGAIIAEAPHEHQAMTLIVDIGTNGEIVLGNRDGLWASSCAMGPALEGAQISSGMRAEPGAIHQVNIDPVTYQAHYEVLGGEAGVLPTGICGSGIIDLVAAMRRGGLLLADGRIKAGLPGVETDERGMAQRFILVPGEKTATGRDLAITQLDIRQIQLAKAALAVGISFLMRLAGVARIDHLVLTGAFGARFDWQNAVTLGMLPAPAELGEVATVVNAAGLGAIMALLDKKRRTEAEELSRRVRFLELANEPGFAEAFAAAITFPPLHNEKNC